MTQFRDISPRPTDLSSIAKGEGAGREIPTSIENSVKPVEKGEGYPNDETK